VLFFFKEYELRRKNLQYQSTILRKRTQKLVTAIFYNIRVRPTKNEPLQQGISYLERERFKVRLGLGDIDR
jgi:hypothetical protein